MPWSNHSGRDCCGWQIVLLLSCGSRRACARPDNESLQSLSSESVTPGFISTTSTPGTNFCNAPGVPVSTGNVPKCMGMTVLALQQIAGIGSFARPHGVVIADRHHGDVRRIELVNDPHIAENIGIAGMINLQAGGEFDDVAAGFPAINQLVAILDAAGVVGMHHGDFDVAHGLRAAFVHLREVLHAFLSQPAAKFRNANDCADCASWRFRPRRRCDRRGRGCRARRPLL